VPVPSSGSNRLISSPGSSAGSLDDRLTAESGTFFFPGLVMLVRLILDQQRRDQADGRRTRGLVTGYPGSPLAGLDLQLERAGKLLAALGIVHQPAAAEERAMGALMGSQMLDGFPHSECDGVVGYWYGKGPGVDRSGDAMRHGNFAGTSEQGGVVILSGEDHEASSSTMPFQQEYAFVSAGIPVLHPASVAEFHELGLHAVAMSRFSGCWVALKLVTQLCDGGQSVTLSPDQGMPESPVLELGGRPFRKQTDFTFFPGRNIDVERQLYRERHAAVLAYAQKHQLNRIIAAADGDRLGIVTAGKSYADVRQALADIGLDGEALARSPLRLLKVGLSYPLDPSLLPAFAAGLDQILVVEEKRDFLEMQVKAALHNAGVTVPVAGKQDASGSILLPVEGGLDADLLLGRIGPLFADYVPAASALSARTGRLADVAARSYTVQAARTPNYCSGCPHSLSTRLPAGRIAWGSPGCHSFATVMEQPERHITAMTQLGGEALPWIGLAPFTDQRHMVQNIGDGSLWHSAYDNIRACVAAGVNITVKILYNGVVANTGAQSAPGARSIPQLTRLLEQEGVTAIALLTKQPRGYRRAGLSHMTTLHKPDDIITVQDRLEQTPGVTVLIYDELCANERRRLRKRGKMDPPTELVVINDRVCENCGDCGAKSNCMSLQKRPTVFGEKTMVHPSSCNQDYSCLQGDCPSFVTVRVAPGTGYRRPDPPRLAADEIPGPDPLDMPAGDPYRIFAPGVGGTGVLTMNAILAVAATLDGLEVASYDQTGAAQKWGTVLSTLTLAPAGVSVWSNKVGKAQADLCLGLDLVAAASPAYLDRYAADRTAAVLNSDVLPTGEMVRNVWADFDASAATASIAAYARPGQTVTVPARAIAEALFGDYVFTNMVTLGAAVQAGRVPVSPASIESAIALGKVAAEDNIQAFRYGRLWAADPGRVTPLLTAAEPDPRRAWDDAVAALTPRSRSAYERIWALARGLDDSSSELLGLRVADLVDYQNPAYAGTYISFVLEVAAREEAVCPGQRALTRAVIKNLHKLMAYKDEYEVARLHLKAGWRDELARTFEAPLRVSYRLHPPLLRSLGLNRKLELGPWFSHVLAVLRRLRALRGTRLDPFGYAAVRREERALISWYREVTTDALAHLTPRNYSTATEIAELPDRIRGYEDLKLRAGRQARERAAALIDEMQRPRLPVTIVPQRGSA
jgi:indolepyruvate ferredoxin oxidoreductase